MLEFLQNYGVVIAFYLAVILLVYFNRKKFQFEGKIIAMYKTKLGIEQMKKLSTPLKEPYNTIGKYVFYASLSLTLLAGVALFVNSLAEFLSAALLSLAAWVFIASFLALLSSIIIFRRMKEGGVLGIYVGFMGMFFIIYLVFFGLYQLLFRPDADPLFTPVLPGISIPGSPITLPLVEGLIALFVVIVVHEFSHGVVSKAYKIPIKSSGLVMLGPIPGAFVEPDEKKLQKSSRKTQLSIFAAGPFSNVLLALLVMMIILGAGIITTNMYESSGVLITGFPDETKNLPGGRLEMLEKGEVITSVNNEQVNSVFDLVTVLQNASPGDTVLLQTNLGEKEMVLDSHPNNESLPYIGINLGHQITPRQEAGFVFPDWAKNAWLWFFGNPFGLTFNQTLGLFGWIFVLSLGIGIVNLLPAGPVDGGKMYLLVLEKHFKKPVAKRIWMRTFQLILIIVAVLILTPIFRALFF